MAAISYGTTTIGGTPAPFPKTRWTLICQARDHGDRRELHELLADYWRPLYAFLRYQGRDADAAMDAVQGFLLHLLQRDFAAALDPHRGKFRSYLLAALKNYLVNEHAKATAHKRGGPAIPVSLDVSGDTRTYEPAAPDVPPERLFEREWAVCLLERAVAALKQEFADAGRAAHFEALRRFFQPDDEPPSHEEVARDLGVTKDNLKVMLHRARRRFAELVRAEIRDVVASDAEVEEELASLFRALGR